MKIRQRRKNFLPTLLLVLFFWLGLGWIIFWVRPESFFPITIFFIFFFCALFLTSALILANSRRGLLVALGLTAFLILRYHQLANFLNLCLLLGILFFLELFYRRC